MKHLQQVLVFIALAPIHWIGLEAIVLRQSTVSACEFAPFSLSTLTENDPEFRLGPAFIVFCAFVVTDLDVTTEVDRVFVFESFLDMSIRSAD